MQRALLLAILLCPAPAYAQLFARADVGGGLAQTSSTGLDTRVTGVSAATELAVGYEVLENVFAAGAVFGDFALGARRRTGEITASDVDLALFGAGLAGQVVSASGWHWGGGLYLVRQRARSAAGRSLDAVAAADARGPAVPIEDSGFGGGVVVRGGREWRVRESLWLGFAIRGLFAQLDTSVTRWAPVAATLSLSLSYR